jgi:hypothetical protein
MSEGICHGRSFSPSIIHRWQRKCKGFNHKRRFLIAASLGGVADCDERELQKFTQKMPFADPWFPKYRLQIWKALIDLDWDLIQAIEKSVPFANARGELIIQKISDESKGFLSRSHRLNMSMTNLWHGTRNSRTHLRILIDYEDFPSGDWPWAWNCYRWFDTAIRIWRKIRFRIRPKKSAWSIVLLGVDGIHWENSQQVGHDHTFGKKCRLLSIKNENWKSARYFRITGMRFRL